MVISSLNFSLWDRVNTSPLRREVARRAGVGGIGGLLIPEIPPQSASLTAHPAGEP